MFALAFFIGLTGLAPAEMADIVAERLRALDKLVLEVTLETFGINGDTPILDPDVWGTPIESYPFVLTILRPYVRVESLKDDAARGYQPLITYVAPDICVAQPVHPNQQDGRTMYVLSWNTKRSGVEHLLEVCELRLMGGADATFDLVALLRHPATRLVSCVGERCTYAAYLPAEAGAPWDRYFELELNERGTLLRLKTVLDFNDPKTPCLTQERFTWKTAELNGAELPIDTVITSQWDLTPHYWAAMRVQVRRAECKEELSLADVQLDVHRQNAHVVEYFADGTSLSTTYDEDGQIISQDRYDPSNTLATRGRWRQAIPPLAVTVGLVAVALLLRFSRPAAR